MALMIRTDDDNEAACMLYGLSPTELAGRFADVNVLGRWFAYENGVAVGVAVASERPDRRVFVTHRIRSEVAFAPLLERALGAIDGPAHVTTTSDLADRMRICEELGLRKELTSMKYDVSFEKALQALQRKRVRRRLEIKTANEVDPDLLFALDTELRGDVPGTDGWIGNRSWFDDELRSPDFDNNGYLVAVEPSTGTLVGLCRMWRNTDGPALGMLGVIESRRNGFTAVELFRETLTRASLWDWPTFSVHTARPGLQRHLDHAGAIPTGGFVRFLRA